ncbi:hypothetical protein HN011_009015 [Eciton burchellii]|nr:hypothetical protein HN011_009015 [Eciton burchellii]
MIRRTKWKTTDTLMIRHVRWKKIIVCSWSDMCSRGRRTWSDISSGKTACSQSDISSGNRRLHAHAQTSEVEKDGRTPIACKVEKDNRAFVVRHTQEKKTDMVGQPK